MLREINRQLRKLLILLSAIAALVAIFGSLRKEDETPEHQAHEFDDIW